jgi:DNA-binding NarL/FixJ family response regulator
MSPLPAASGAIRVLVADSSSMRAQLFATALRRHAEFRIACCPMEITALLHAVVTAVPAVVLLAANSPASRGEDLATLHQFQHAYPDIQKIFLVDASDRGLVVNAFRAGARGIFCVSEGNLKVLHKCILRVADGQIWANTEQLNFLVDTVAEIPAMRVTNFSGDQLLTPREEQVVALVIEGLGNREIARKLNLSPHTVKKYLFHVFEKLGISNRVELVLYAMNHGEQRHSEWRQGVNEGRKIADLMPPQADFRVI